MGYKVRILDDFSTGDPSRVNSNVVEVVYGSILDPSDAKRAIEDMKVAFHLAAIASVRRSFSEPELTYRVNVEGTKNMIEQSLKAKVERLVVSSSAAVHGNINTPVVEQTPTNPISPYGRSKLEAKCLSAF